MKQSEAIKDEGQREIGSTTGIVGQIVHALSVQGRARLVWAGVIQGVSLDGVYSAQRILSGFII